MGKTRPLRERLLSRALVDLDGPRLIDEAPCWLWSGAVVPDGYGQIYDSGTMRGVHVVAYEMWFGPLPPGYEPDHLCRVRRFNPAHLEGVTHRINVLRGEGVCAQRARARQARGGSCNHGHELTPANTKWQRDRHGDLYGVCRACAVAANRRYRARKCGEPQQ